MINCEYIFPTPVWSFFYDLDINFIEEKIYDLKNSSYGRVVSNVNGWQSSDYYMIDSQTFGLSSFFNFISKNIPIFLESFGTKDKSLQVDNFWFNINSTSSFNKPHIHAGSFLSGVMYIKVPDNSGNIIFHRSSSEQYILYSNISNASGVCGYTSWKYKPEECKCIIFPSWVSHEVEINENQNDRISIAFNLSWK